MNKIRMSNELEELRSSWNQQYTPLKRTFARQRDHRYVLIDCELVDVGHITNNLCGRHGLQNHNCGT